MQKTTRIRNCQNLRGPWMSGAGLAPVPRHSFLHNLDRAREFGRDVAIVKHVTTVCALARTDRAFLRDAKNFLRFLRASKQSRGTPSKS
ncbi:MAG: hypothetical protein IOB85_16315 [Methylobacterium sp.]|nr:hypothetical protein [Methylobacterium sp.]MCA3672948.1 hypothetical protein [Methylobacterium sp.]MCA3679321.1 hypothetical protein [Methylobacterium sp.]MCA3682491.1 hypothetical protein [Methylobacterium sp.]MCA3686221.1 hypothetical protein [Methylobacterium sp.]